MAIEYPLRYQAEEKRKAQEEYNRRRREPYRSSARAQGASARTRENGRQRGFRKRLKLFSVRAGLDMPFLLLILILLVIGIIMMFSASYPVAYYTTGDSYLYLKRQLLFAVIGVIMMLAISFFDYHHFHKMAVWILGLGFLLLVVVLFMPSQNGIHRWIELGIAGFQASELMKFALILFFAHWGSVYFYKMDTFKYGVLPAVVILVPTVVLLLLEPHYSGIVIVTLLTALMMFISGVKGKWFLFAGAGILAVFMIMYATGLLSYAMERMDGWGQALEYTTPEMWQTTWQTRNSMYAIGSGGLMGLGLGQSRQKYLYLPEPQNDFVFAIVCEELGLIGAVIILGIFALLVWRGITISMKAKDKFGTLLGVGLTSQVGLQVILNILVITDLLPNTGISLPFFSSGGSSLVMLLAQMGIVLSISRTSNINKA